MDNRARNAGQCVGALALLLGVGWLGFRVRPAKPPPHSEPTHDLGTLPLPPDLPPPVRRYFLQVMGDQMPRIESAVIWGRARLRIAGIWMPAVFKGYYVPGRHYEREIQTTWFRLPLLTAIDSYKNGIGAFELRGLGGRIRRREASAQIASSGNLVQWAEAVWMPSVLALDPRVRWEAIDDGTARLMVPFDSQEDSILVSFAAETGLIARMQAMRYRGAHDEEQTPWHVDLSEWTTFERVKLPARVTVTWDDQKSQWAEFVVEGVAYNVDVSVRLPAVSGAER